MSQGNSAQKIKKMIKAIVAFEILCLWLGFTLGVISSVVDFSDLCFKRYTFSGLNGGSAVGSNVSIRADANYTSNVVNQGNVSQSISEYNKWKRLNFKIQPSSSLTFKVSGVVSLCRAYLPLYNLQDINLPSRSRRNIYYTKDNGSLIPIPRIDENTEPLTLIFDARTRGWRNLTEVYNGDIVKVILKDNLSPFQTIPVDPLSTVVSQADCNNIVDVSARQQCLAAFSAMTPTQSSVADCSSIQDPNVRASCIQQYDDVPPPAGMSLSDCNNLEPHMVDICRDTVRRDSSQSRPSPRAPPTNPEPTPLNISLISVTDSITGVPTIADCSENKRQYSPVCGRYSLWNGTTNYYRSEDCTCHTNHTNDREFTHSRCGTWQCGSRCNAWNPFGACLFGRRVPIYCYKHCYTCSPRTIPERYKDNGIYTKSRFTNQNAFLSDWSINPQGSRDSCSLSYTPITKFWFSATDAAGLQYRFHNNAYPGRSTSLGSNYNWAKIINPLSDIYSDEYTPRKIYSDDFSAADVSYMQFRFHGSEYSTTQTGGYVIQLLQTKCRRERGAFFSDSLENRGAIQYVILPSGSNPNSNPALASSPANMVFQNGVANFDSGSNEGYMWLKIKNNLEDYPDSTGSYRISVEGVVDKGSFTLQILNPLFKILREKVYDIAMGTFAKITCYQMRPTDSCINFFNYINAILILYIMILGFRFLLGANIKHEELVKSLIKVVILIGLMNGGTFEFFRENLYPIITGFSDQIISNMSGFSMISSTNSVENPFMFADALLSKMFLNPTFLFQLLTTMTMGITGLLYFMIICVGVVIFAIAIFRAMAVYIMAMLATALLIGVAPIFISFLLFERTYYLFENWAKATFKYMMEPVIVMAGIIILTQLFTLYIDQVLSFSLCWKCALPFKIPFADLLPFPGLANIPLFCIYWFSPWGLDPVNDPMSINLAMVVGLAMVAYSAYGYIEFAAKIATRLMGGGASSVDLGRQMASDLGSKISDAAIFLQDAAAKSGKNKPKGDIADGESGDGKGDDKGDTRRPTIGGPPDNDGAGGVPSGLDPKPSIELGNTSNTDKVSSSKEGAPDGTSSDKPKAKIENQGSEGGVNKTDAESTSNSSEKQNSATKLGAIREAIGMGSEDSTSNNGESSGEELTEEEKAKREEEKQKEEESKREEEERKKKEEEKQRREEEDRRRREEEEKRRQLEDEERRAPEASHEEEYGERDDIGGINFGEESDGLFTEEQIEGMDEDDMNNYLVDMFDKEFGAEKSNELLQELDQSDKELILKNGIEDAKEINPELKDKLDGFGESDA